MGPFFFDCDVTIGVKDLDAAVRWYEDHLDLRRNLVRISDEFDALLDQGQRRRHGLALVQIAPGRVLKVDQHPILFTNEIESSHRFFVNRVPLTTPIQSDSGGNRFFRFQDPEGNTIEVCTEPQ